MTKLSNEFNLQLANLPLWPVKNQVLYIENHPHPELEEYLKENLSVLEGIFACRGLQLVYLPKVLGQMKRTEFDTTALFYMPWLTPSDLEIFYINCCDDPHYLFSTVALPDDKPILVNAKGNAFTIDTDHPEMFSVCFRESAELFYDHRVKTNTSSNSKKKNNFYRPLLNLNISDLFADESYESESRPSKVELPESGSAKEKSPKEKCSVNIPPKLEYQECFIDDEQNAPETNESGIRYSVKEVDYAAGDLEDEELKRLYRQAVKTIPGWAIKEALKNLMSTQEVISRLVITPQGKLFLPEYNNIEIKLTPKEKSIYFLYLKHPEGIRLKELPDYRNELAHFYRHVARGDDPQAIEATIDRMIVSISGDADVQRSKIKASINKAFNRQFCQQFARYYTIEGTKGQAMKIDLPRTLVDWEWDI